MVRLSGEAEATRSVAERSRSEAPMSSSARLGERGDPCAGHPSRCRGLAVEFEACVPSGGTVTIASRRQAVSVKQGLAGRTLTI
jgi:hypothetical protein